MMLCLGIASYGAARVLRSMHGGYLIAAAGLLGATMVRPHVSVVFMAGFVAAYFLRRTPGRQSALGPIAKVVGIVVLIAAMSLVLRQSEEFLKVDSLSSKAAEEVRRGHPEEHDPRGLAVRDRGEGRAVVAAMGGGHPRVPTVPVGDAERGGAVRLARGRLDPVAVHQVGENG